jgi:phosphoserine phosphatase RsbU/P
VEESILTRIPIFSSLRPGEIRHLLDNLRPVHIKAGELLFHEGERGECFYIIIEGRLEVIKAMGTPDERLLNVRGPGDYIGEMSLLDPDGLRTASVFSTSDSRLLAMERGDFEFLLNRRPSIGQEMARTLSRRLRDTDNAIIRDLQEKNRQLNEAYENLKAAQAQIIEKEKLERELQLALEIQLSMLPRELPSVPGYEFGATMAPARVIGGDFFDFVPLDEDHLGIAIGDVSDKGIPAAIFMAMTRSLMRSEARRNESPRKTLKGVNRHLLEMNDAGMFVTVLYGILNRVTSQFSYARAGHTKPMICRGGGSVVTPAAGAGQPLAVFAAPDLDEQTVILAPGDVMLIYTDGVTDATDSKGILFGLDRLEKALAASCHRTAQGICDQFIETVSSYEDGQVQNDDITLVTVRRLAF